MGKLISVVTSAIVGVALAVAAAYGVVSASTKAPSHNPANAQVVDYGTR